MSIALLDNKNDVEVPSVPGHTKLKVHGHCLTNPPKLYKTARSPISCRPCICFGRACVEDLHMN